MDHLGNGGDDVGAVLVNGVSVPPPCGERVHCTILVSVTVPMRQGGFKRALLG